MGECGIAIGSGGGGGKMCHMAQGGGDAMQLAVGGGGGGFIPRGEMQTGLYFFYSSLISFISLFNSEFFISKYLS